MATTVADETPADAGNTEAPAVPDSASPSAIGAAASGVALLAERVRSVRFNRAAEGVLTAELAARRKKFDDEVAGLVTDIKAAGTRTEQSEEELRTLALAHYEATQEKEPTPGVKIVMRKKLRYDPKLAFEWAQLKDMCLIPEQLDVKAFDRIATVTDIDFVTREEHPAPTIATDLTKAIEP